MVGGRKMIKNYTKLFFFLKLGWLFFVEQESFLKEMYFWQEKEKQATEHCRDSLRNYILENRKFRVQAFWRRMNKGKYTCD